MPVGNDVVDLLDPEAQPGAQHPRFDARVFSADELTALANSATPHRTRWLMWAAKESSYKLLKRRRASTIFSPVRYAVVLEAGLPTHVHHGAQQLVLTTSCDDDHVHLVATLPDAVGKHLLTAAWQLEGPEADAGHEARERARLAIAAALEVAATDVTIASAGRIPQVLLDGEPAPIGLSLSHHGRYAAYALIIEAS